MRFTHFILITVTGLKKEYMTRRRRMAKFNNDDIKYPLQKYFENNDCLVLVSERPR